MHFLIHYNNSSIAFMKLKLRPSARQEKFSSSVVLSGHKAVSESLACKRNLYANLGDSFI